MNELIFFLHLLIVILFSFAARRLGKMAVFSFIIVQSILANLFVIKQMELCGFTVTCSDVYAVGSIIALNVLQEDYEKIDAQRAVGLSFFFCFSLQLDHLSIFYMYHQQAIQLTWPMQEYWKALLE